MNKPFLEKLFGIKLVDGYCATPPIGCGEIISDFDDEVSAMEYEISGLCQSCQNRVFDETACEGGE